MQRMDVLLKKMFAFVLCLYIALTFAACTSNPAPPTSHEPILSPNTDTTDMPSEAVPTVIRIGERWKHVLYGLDKLPALLDIPTDKEYTDYLAAVWDENANSFIEGHEQIRGSFIEETEQAYEYNNSSLNPLRRTGFYATLINSDVDDAMGVMFDWLFYSVTSSTGESFVLPSEWEIGNNPALYFDSNRSALYVSTFLGIWRVSADGKSEKLTSDEYDGRHYSWHDEAAYIHESGWSGLFWVTHMTLSPDRRYIVYQSNRDCYNERNANTSIWRIDLETDEEQLILEGNAVNTINGFVTDKLALIDGRFLLDVSNGEIIPITLPDTPNRSLIDTGFGYIVCDSYKEEDAGLSSLNIFRVEPTTGTLTEVFAEIGVFRGFRFSPSGRFAHAEYGTDPNRGAETLMLFNFEKMSTQLLENVLGEVHQKLNGDIIRAQWLTDNAMLLQVISNVESKGVSSTWLAQW